MRAIAMIVVGLAVLLAGPRPSSATLKKARPYYLKARSNCRLPVKDHMRAVSGRNINFSAIEDTAKDCFELTKELAEALNKVGAGFKDSKNRSWAGSAKRDAVRAATAARQAAEVLRTEANRTMNPMRSLKDLDKAFEEFRELDDAHKSRLSKLARAVDDIGRRWKQEAKDDLPAYNRAVEKASRTRKDLFEMQKKESEEARRLSAAVRDTNAAWKTGEKSKIERAYKKMFVSQRKLNGLAKQIAMKHKAYQEAQKKVDQEWERFVKEAKKTVAMITDDVAETIDRMSEFAKEYQ